VIDFEGVTVTYDGCQRPVLRDVSLSIPEGELCLVVGHTGAGKSTLLGAINGHVPHFTGGTLEGTVHVAGLDTRTHPPRELAGVVGVVVQDPIRGFVADTVEDELAYGMEQLAVPDSVMRKRVEETLDLLGLADLRRRPLDSLSGGQQQRVAIGSVLTAHPKVLVLDEPTSALDPAAAEDVLAALTRLVHDLGLTVVLAEHRLERVIEFADMVVDIDRNGTITAGDPAMMMRRTAVAPPVVRLGQLAGWDPLPLSVRDARRRAGDLKVLIGAPPERTPAASDRTLLEARHVVVRYGSTVAVAGVDLDLRAGTITALMGRNGSGKSSLLWALIERSDHVSLLPQSPGDLLYLPSVDAECEQADRQAANPPGSCRELLDQIVPGVDGASHPRDLSEGQRLGLALAVQLSPRPDVALLDEPTRGLDEPGKRRLAGVLASLAGDGRAIVVATHDVEFVAAVADRVVVLAGGEIVADGPTADVVVASPVFAPQIAKVLQPARWLTVDQVAAALERSR
jgi:energy-coupling factor transporter ATP-binding protein EcfA2